MRYREGIIALACSMDSVSLRELDDEANLS